MKVQLVGIFSPAMIVLVSAKTLSSSSFKIGCSDRCRLAGWVGAIAIKQNYWCQSDIKNKSNTKTSLVQHLQLSCNKINDSASVEIVVRLSPSPSLSLYLVLRTATDCSWQECYLSLYFITLQSTHCTCSSWPPQTNSQLQ